MEETANKLAATPTKDSNKNSWLIKNFIYWLLPLPMKLELLHGETLELLARDIAQAYLEPEDGEVDTYSPIFIRWDLATKFILENEHYVFSMN